MQKHLTRHWHFLSSIGFFSFAMGIGLANLTSPSDPANVRLVSNQACQTRSPTASLLTFDETHPSNDYSPEHSCLSLRASKAEIAPPGTLLATTLNLPSTLRHWIAQHQSQIDTQGDRLLVNGRLLNAPWKRHDDRFLISEPHVMQGLGIELLSSITPDEQPLQWFSDESTPLPLAPASIDGQRRYLDITALAQSQGWHIHSQGATLSLQTPAARIISVRHGRQTWGDRLVIDLDRPVPFQSVRGTDTVSVRVDAPLLSDMELPDPRLTNHLSSIQADLTESHTTLNLATKDSKRVQVWTVPSPPRIVIDIGSQGFPEKQIHWLPGLWWHQRVVSIANKNFPVTYLEIRPQEATNLSLQPIWANRSSMEGITPLSTMANEWGAIAAINGGFFNRNNHLPLGAIRRNGQWYSGPILNRGAIAWNTLDDLHINRLSLQDTIRLNTGQALASLHLNSGYVRAGLSRYTPQWGTHYTPLTDFETLISIVNGQITAQQRVESAGSQAIPIPANGYLLTARSFQTAVEMLQSSRELQAMAIANPSSFDTYANALGAGPLLVQNGQIVVNGASEGFSEAFIQQRAPRSAIAQTASGSILMVTTLNALNGSGASLQDMARMLINLGAVEALNLDGGNSTSLYLGGQLLTPDHQRSARIHNGLGIFMAPDIVSNQ
jgi:hypothetical protein